MQANHEITPELLKNENEFNDPFFLKHHLKPIQEPLVLTNEIKKQYMFPTFYNNVSCSMGVFFCNYDRAQALLPDRNLRPINMLKGRSIVLISCYQYRSVYNIKPYNEIAMTIPVLLKTGLQLPIIPLLVPSLKNFGYFVFHMPVTSKENQIRGNKIWGLPKVTQKIDIIQNGDYEETTAYESDGTLYFKLRVPTGGKTTSVEQHANLFTKPNHHLLKSHNHFKGSFCIQKNLNLLFQNLQHQKNSKFESPIFIGNSTSAHTLASLAVDPRPFQFRYSNCVRSIFDLPTSVF